MCFVQRDFPCNSYLAPSRVRNDSNHDSVQPGRERRVTAKLGKPRERADESVLSELTSLFRIAAQSIRERVHPGRMRVVQRAPGQPISRNDPGDELSFVHAMILFAVATMVAIKFDTGRKRIDRSADRSALGPQSEAVSPQSAVGLTGLLVDRPTPARETF